MGAKLGRIKSLSISDKDFQQEKIKIIGTTNAITREQWCVKKKGKTSKNKANQFTEANGSKRPLLSHTIQYLSIAKSNHRLNELHSMEANADYSSENSSKDVLEFREACIRRGIISSDMDIRLLVTSNEENNQVTNSEPPVEPLTTTVTNDEALENEQVQAMSQ